MLKMKYFLHFYTMQIPQFSFMQWNNSHKNRIHIASSGREREICADYNYANTKAIEAIRVI